MKLTRRAFATALAALGTCSVASARSGAGSPVLGDWFGSVTHGSDTGTIAFRFERKNGTTIARLWNPALHFYGTIAAPSVFDEHGNVVVRGYALRARVQGDTMSGTVLDGETRVVLHRVASIPLQAPARPVVSAGPRAIWTYRGAAFWGSPLVIDGVAFAGDERGTLHAVRAHDGTPLWRYAAGAALRGSPLHDGEAVLVLDDDGVLHRVHRERGVATLKTSLAARIARKGPSATDGSWDYGSPAPLVAGGTVYVGTADGVMHAVDARTGAPRWRYRARGPIRSSAAADAQHLYFGDRSGAVTALHRSNGKELWRRQTGGPIVMAPVPFEDTILIGSRGSELMALSKASGAVRWRRFYWASWIESAPALAGGTAYVGSSDLRTVRAFDPATGRTLWETDVYGMSWGTPLIDGGSVYAGTAGLVGGSPQHHEPGLVALNARDGAMRWRTPGAARGPYVCGYSCGPVLGEAGTVLFASVDGTLSGFRIGGA
ncbi:MAG TPA: PQQ-binding-like beta-propeller repeat protein [Candidatus Elarobacter sp.]|nr:PQQ-binding-like beta-propeller repeat protein [Candidatus Elarobacter sp.]